MSQNFSTEDGQLFANLQRAAIATSEMKNLVQQEIDDLRQEKFELQQEIDDLRQEKFELQQRIDDLRRERQSNYCDNDGSPNCKLSRSRICYG
jgi:FtsZ-binding cell division protein ZapB